MKVGEFMNVGEVVFTPLEPQNNQPLTMTRIGRRNSRTTSLGDCCHPIGTQVVEERQPPPGSAPKFNKFAGSKHFSVIFKRYFAMRNMPRLKLS
jgi:hypothetical protein